MPENKEVLGVGGGSRNDGLVKIGQLEGTPTREVWDNLSIIISMSTMDYNS